MQSNNIRWGNPAIASTAHAVVPWRSDVVHPVAGRALVFPASRNTARSSGARPNNSSLYNRYPPPPANSYSIGHGRNVRSYVRRRNAVARIARAYRVFNHRAPYYQSTNLMNVRDNQRAVPLRRTRRHDNYLRSSINRRVYDSMMAARAQPGAIMAAQIAFRNRVIPQWGGGMGFTDTNIARLQRRNPSLQYPTGRNRFGAVVVPYSS